jgi:hypothetical protein
MDATTARQHRDATRFTTSTSVNKVCHAPSNPSMLLVIAPSLTQGTHRRKQTTKTPPRRRIQPLFGHASSTAPRLPAPAEHTRTAEFSTPRSSSPSSSGYAHKTQRISGCSSRAARRSYATHTPKHARVQLPQSPLLLPPTLRTTNSSSARGRTRRSAR